LWQCWQIWGHIWQQVCRSLHFAEVTAQAREAKNKLIETSIKYLDLRTIEHGVRFNIDSAHILKAFLSLLAKTFFFKMATFWGVRRYKGIRLKP
jgi:hypothetical protein